MEQDFPGTPDTDDTTAERALERLASGWIPQDAAVADSGDAAIRTELEALALLAYELEPEMPAAGTKQSLMAAIRSQASPDTGKVASMPRRSPVDMTLQHSTVPDDPVELETQGFDAGDKTLMMGVPADVVSMRPSRSGVPMSTWALAAALAFCLIGLGYLYGQVNAKNVVIAMQQDRLESNRDLESLYERSQDDLRRMQDSLAMVTTVAQTAYPLRPASNTPGLGRNPEGKVFVCGQHQRWYLSLSHLEPPPEGHEYHLWFLTKEGAVDAGKFEVRSGVVGMQDLTMPDGTEGFQITLEPIGGGDVPAGKPIMIGDRPVSL